MLAGRQAHCPHDPFPILYYEVGGSIVSGNRLVGQQPGQPLVSRHPEWLHPVPRQDLPQGKGGVHAIGVETGPIMPPETSRSLRPGQKALVEFELDLGLRAASIPISPEDQGLP